MLHQIVWGGLTGFALLIVSLPAYSLPLLAESPMAPAVVAQSTTVSSKDLQKFADVLKQLRTIEQDLKPKVDKIVQSSGISQPRFQAIALSQKDPSQKLNPPLTADEEKKFAQATNSLKPIFADLQTKSQKAVTDQGLTIPQFQAIGKAVQNDPKLKDQVRALLKK